MHQSDVRALYSEAIRRWPTVPWPLVAFAAHLGTESPKWPSDLYLAGAAGHRVDPAWEAVETELGPRIRGILSRLPTADLAIDDLWGETVARLMDDEEKWPPLPQGRHPARIIRYRGRAKLLNYFILIARRIAIQRQRQHNPALSLTEGGRNDDDVVQIEIDSGSPRPEAPLQEIEAVAAMQRQLGEAHAALSAEQQFLIAMVYHHGMKQKEAGAMLGWNASKTSRVLSAALELLRDALIAVSELEWTPVLAAAWAGCWSKSWKSVQEPPAKASKSRVA